MELYRKRLWKGMDPFTMPRTKVEKTDDGIFGTPSATVRTVYGINVIDIVVTGPDEDDVKRQLDTCVDKALVDSALTGITVTYLTKGDVKAGMEAAVATLVVEVKACIQVAIGRAVEVDAQIDTRFIWSDEDDDVTGTPATDDETRDILRRLGVLQASIGEILFS